MRASSVISVSCEKDGVNRRSLHLLGFSFVFFPAGGMGLDRAPGAALHARPTADALHMVGCGIGRKIHGALPSAQTALVAGVCNLQPSHGHLVEGAQDHAKGAQILAKRPVHRNRKKKHRGESHQLHRKAARSVQRTGDDPQRDQQTQRPQQNILDFPKMPLPGQPGKLFPKGDAVHQVLNESHGTDPRASPPSSYCQQEQQCCKEHRHPPF